MDADGGKGRKREACLVRKHREFKSDTETHAFPSSCSSFRAVPFPLCHKEERETHFLFCLSRNVGRPDRLAFHWQCTAESSPCGSFSRPLLCVSMRVCFYSLICVIRPPGLPQADGGAVKRKPESALRSGGNCHTKCLTQLSHCEGILQLNIYKT